MEDDLFGNGERRGYTDTSPTPFSTATVPVRFRKSGVEGSGTMTEKRKRKEERKRKSERWRQRRRG